MRMNLKATVAALIIGATTLVAVAPADAQWRGRGGHHHHRGYNNGGAIIGGLAAGALLGGIIASQNRGPYYDDGYRPVYREAPGYYAGGGGDRDAYCFSRYKSYDPRSGTYLGYDGYRHPCE
ncbi:MAG: BA14K family protein [Pseudolabrys sp.]|nr:BA14K family protein [Pseudolabrys sp.]